MSGSKLMSVPDRIQLSSALQKSGQSQAQYNQYKPMKVPDKITLVEGMSDEDEDHQGSSGGDRTGLLSQSSSSLIKGNINQSESPMMVTNGNQADDTPLAVSFHDLAGRLDELERRVRSLEDSRARPNAGSSGNGFWYVVTFSGWMLVPLIAAFIFYHKRYH